MYAADDLQVWNLSQGGRAGVGAQDVFNVLGRLADPDDVESFSYRLNGSDARRIHFRDGNDDGKGRLARLGDFSIDTLRTSELQDENRMELRVERRSGGEVNHRIDFAAERVGDHDKRFRLELDGADSVEEVGQVVEGAWEIARDERGVPCLQVRRDEAGYDRIILFGRSDWTTGYEVTATLEPTEWTSGFHNFGLLFKWNTHHVGDGTCLPTTWSTGLGYYCSYTPGLRLRFGTDVHVDETGRKLGDHVLREEPYSWLRYRAWRIANGRFRRGWKLPQFPAGRRYRYRLRIDPARYELTAWRDGAREPAPQVVVEEPVEHLEHGAVGVIALDCAVRVHGLEVCPIEEAREP